MSSEIQFQRRALSLCILALVFLSFGALSRAQGRFPYSPRDIPVRDGNTLAADLYSTDTTMSKPVILIQTPYNKAFYRLGLKSLGGSAFPYDTAKYHYVIMDWRGFYGSKDADVKGYDRGLDGYDAVEWIAAQRWSNGKVGTWGLSALGIIQFQTARHHPPHLVCAIPCVADYKTQYSDYFYGGVFRKEHVESLQKLGFLTTELITSQPMYNLVWRSVESGSDYPEQISVPMLLIGGWFDHYPDDVTRAFQDLSARSDSSVRGAHKIIFGPWTHGEIGLEKQGELSYPNAVDEARDAALQFFGYYLHQEKNGYPLRPPFRYYQLGSDEWRDLGRDSSITPMTRRQYWLHSGGTLGGSAPTEQSASATIVYDPRDPSPSHGGARFNPTDPSAVPGPLDIRDAVESRPDALVFSTDPFIHELEIHGPVTATLIVSSDRLDTDMSVRLCDVFPDGRSMIMADGIRRGRFRTGVDRQVALLPGTPDTFRVELQNLGLSLQAGHRLRIVVSSSNYPRFDINLNNGGAMYTAGDTLIARNTVFFDATQQSHITFYTATTSSVVTSASTRSPYIGLNYPNPANASTTFPFEARQGSGSVTVLVTDVLGRMVAVLYAGDADAAPRNLIFDAASVPDGTYLCRVYSAQGNAVRVFTVHR